MFVYTDITICLCIATTLIYFSHSNASYSQETLLELHITMFHLFSLTLSTLHYLLPQNQSYTLKLHYLSHSYHSANPQSTDSQS